MVAAITRSVNGRAGKSRENRLFILSRLSLRGKYLVYTEILFVIWWIEFK